MQAVPHPNSRSRSPTPNPRRTLPTPPTCPQLASVRSSAQKAQQELAEQVSTLTTQLRHAQQDVHGAKSMAAKLESEAKAAAAEVRAARAWRWISLVEPA